MKKKPNKTGSKKNKTVCLPELRNYLRSSKVEMPEMYGRILPCIIMHPSVQPERVRSITITRAAGGGHSCRPSQHFPLYRERRRYHWARWPWHNTLLRCTQGDTPKHGCKRCQCQCGIIALLADSSSFPLCSGGMKHWHMVTRTSATRNMWAMSNT